MKLNSNEAIKILLDFFKFADECGLNYEVGEQCEDLVLSETEKPKSINCEVCGKIF